MQKFVFCLKIEQLGLFNVLTIDRIMRVLQLLNKKFCSSPSNCRIIEIFLFFAGLP